MCGGDIDRVFATHIGISGKVSLLEATPPARVRKETFMNFQDGSGEI